jgi:endonuclease/exonuclease/phosphatase (EEP) superfamily protein YafD
MQDRSLQAGTEGVASHSEQSTAATAVRFEANSDAKSQGESKRLIQKVTQALRLCGPLLFSGTGKTPSPPRSGSETVSNVNRDESPRVGRRIRARVRRHTRLLAGLGWVAAVILGGGAIVGYFWPTMEPLEGASTARLGLEFAVILAETFRFHAAVAIVPVLAFAAFTIRPRLAIACMPALAAGFASIVASEVGRTTIGPIAQAASGSAPAESASITVISTNVLVGDDRDPEPFLRMLRTHKPDVVVIQEWTESWESRAGAELDSMYPYKVIAIGHGAYGQRVASRLPFAAAPILAPRFSKGQPWRDPQVRFRVAFGNGDITIQNIHTRSPSPLNAFEAIREQRAQMRDLIAWAAEVEAPTIILGDFNSTPDTEYSRELRRAGFQESNSVAGRLRGGTWPRLGYLRYFPGIRLDQVYGKDVNFVESRVLDDIGSDHAPILVRATWRR